MGSTADDWVTIKLPVKLVKKIDEILVDDGVYKSRGEWVKAAVLDKLAVTA